MIFKSQTHNLFTTWKKWKVRKSDILRRNEVILKCDVCTMRRHGDVSHHVASPLLLTTAQKRLGTEDTGYRSCGRGMLSSSSLVLDEGVCFKTAVGCGFALSC